MGRTHRILAGLIGIIFITTNLSSQVQPGDIAPEFSLPGVKGVTVSLADYDSSKGIVLIFTSNTCPFSIAYEERIMKLHKNYAPYGYPVLLINSNDPINSPDDSLEEMKIKANELDYQFSYLKDANQVASKAYGANRNPQVFILKRIEGKFEIAYIGSIDDNVVDAELVGQKYVENALRSIETGNSPVPNIVKAVGCTLK